ncbi:MAG: hypothetical protein KTR24_12940 [Saprospiraceae bacterium]|nr:hypothetical protein [Saprospiraceae bacterium]
MKKLLSVSLFSLLVFAVQAQTADEILTNYFETIGGVDAWKSLKSMKMEGTSSMQGMEFPITVYSKRPNFEKVEISVQGMQIVQAFDGENAWSINPMMGSTEPAKATAEESAEAAKRTFEDAFIDYAEKGHTVELLGTEEIEGTQAHKIRLTKKSGDEEFYYFDAENHVPIMMRSFAAAGPMKGQAVETYLSDYEEHEGLIMPMSMEQRINGQTFMQGTMTSVELNAELADNVFTFPAAEQVTDEEDEMKEGMKKEGAEMKEKSEKIKKKAKEKGSN